mmetsp:Transcript_26374/g.43162  ORF Transcript_26374/g.43162 Transcript_26374/m.43162 type:complete len:471 (+) Transcript_26374:2-1414(+)
MTSYNGIEGQIENTFVGMIKRESPATWRETCSIEPSEENSMQGNSREQMLVGYMLRNLVDVTNRRVSALCELLSVPSASVTTNKTMEVFTAMLHHRTDIFFDRHPDQLMLCSLYAAVSTKGKPEVSFQKITDAYMELNRDLLGSEISYAIVHRIKNCSDHEDQFGDIISLFNEVFVPKMKQLWRSFKEEQQAPSSKPSETPTSRDSPALNTEKVAPIQNKIPSSSQEESNHTEDGIGMDIETDFENNRNGTHQNEVDLEQEVGDIEGPNKPVFDETMKDAVHEDETKKNDECSGADAQPIDEHGPSKSSTFTNGVEAPSTEDAASFDASLLQERKELEEDNVGGMETKGAAVGENFESLGQKGRSDPIQYEEVSDRIMGDSFSLEEKELVEDEVDTRAGDTKMGDDNGSNQEVVVEGEMNTADEDGTGHENKGKDQDEAQVRNIGDLHPTKRELEEEKSFGSLSLSFEEV